MEFVNLAKVYIKFYIAQYEKYIVTQCCHYLIVEY